MKGVSSWDDLRPYGIIPLTGDSCALSYRMVCDVTAKGKKIIEECLACQVALADNRSNGTQKDPHVGSIMFSHEFLIPLGIFALLDSGCTEVWLVWNAVVGIEPKDDLNTVRSMQHRYGDQLKRRFTR